MYNSRRKEEGITLVLGRGDDDDDDNDEERGSCIFSSIFLLIFICLTSKS